MQYQKYDRCNLAPKGWQCTRHGMHNGPCAAIEQPKMFYKILYALFIVIEGIVLMLTYLNFGWSAVLLSMLLSVIVGVRIWIKDAYLKG